MSGILVDITSQAADSAEAGFTEVVDLSATVPVTAGTIVLLIAVVPLDQGDSNDEAADFRFAIDDVLVGPEVTAFKDEINEGCGVAICFAKTGLSGSTKFALQWRNRKATAAVDTGRVRSLQVIEITDASLLVDISSTSADSAVAGYTDIDELAATKTPASADSILVLLTSIDQAILEDATASYQFTIAGTAEGPESKAYEDDLDEGCGMSHIWCKTGISISTVFAVQWDELQTNILTDTGRVRTFQIIEVTANANLLTAVTSVAADALVSAYTDVVDLVDTVTVQDTASILLFFATLPLFPDSDNTAAFQVFEGGTPEGPEQYVFSDTGPTDKTCGHSVYHAVTGKSAGSHTFSIRGQNVKSVANLATAHRRSFCILELLAAVAQVDKEAVDTIDLEVNEGPANLLSLAEVLDILDLEVNEGVGQVAAGITAEDDIDLTIVEETADLLGLIQPVDTTGLSLAEVTQVLSLAERLDTLGISISEVADLLGLMSRTDLLDLEIVEDPAQVAVGIAAEDDVDLDVTEELAQVVVGIATEDTLDLSLVEVSELLALIQASDTVGLTIIEGVPVLFVQATATDLLDLEINEDAGQVSVGIQAEDVLDLEVVEAVGQVTVVILASDLLDLSISEIAQVVGFLNRTDIIDLDLGEQTDLLAFIQATDDLDIELLDVAQLVTIVQAIDDLDIDLGEAASILSTLSVLDILDIDLTESPADRVAFVPFQGILVQPFTLQVTRVARFKLQATRVARFTLQIEGSGEQRP